MIPWLSPHHAFLGSETSSPFSITFTKPSIVRPGNSLQFSLYQTLHKLLAVWSYKEASLGLGATYNFSASPLAARNHHSSMRHSVSYDVMWRNIFDISEAASPSIRLLAGHSLKSAIKYSVIKGVLDCPFLPTSGSMLKFTQVNNKGPRCLDHSTFFHVFSIRKSQDLGARKSSQRPSWPCKAIVVSLPGMEYHFLHLHG